MRCQYHIHYAVLCLSVLYACVYYYCCLLVVSFVRHRRPGEAFIICCIGRRTDIFTTGVVPLQGQSIGCQPGDVVGSITKAS